MRYLEHGNVIAIFTYEHKVLSPAAILLAFLPGAYAQSGHVVYRTFLAPAAHQEGFKTELFFSPTRTIYTSEYYTPNGLSQTIVPESTVDEDGTETINMTSNITFEQSFYLVNDLSTRRLSTVYTTLEGDRVYPCILVEDTPRIQWKLVDSVRTIGEWDARLARCEFRGRSYEVWFVPDIAVSAGPWELNGLPGLIVECRDREGLFSCQLEKLTVGRDVAQPEVVLPKEAKSLTVKEYLAQRNEMVGSVIAEITSRMPRGAKVTSVRKIVEKNQWERNFDDALPKG